MLIIILLTASVVFFITFFCLYFRITDKKIQQESIEEITKQLHSNLDKIDDHYFYMLSKLNASKEDSDEITVEYTVINDTLLLTDGNK